MSRKAQIDTFGAVALTGFALLLAMNQVVIKVTTEGLSPVFMAGLRSAGAALVVLAWMLWLGKSLKMVPGGAIWGLVLGAIFAAEFICLFIALDLTTVARTSVLFYTMPVWLSLAAHVFIPDEKIHAAKALGLALAVAGIIVALADRAGGTASLQGDVLALLSAFGWASIALILRVSPIRAATPELQLFWQLTVSAPLLLGASLFFGPFMRDFTSVHAAGLAFQILAVASLGYLAWFRLLAVYPASGVASFSFLSPVFSVLLGWLILGEEISLGIWLALALVAIGLTLINRPAPQVPQKVSGTTSSGVGGRVRSSKSGSSSKG